MSGINPSHKMTIAGKKYKLRYTLFAADQIEQLTDRPFEKTLQTISNKGQDVKYGDMLTVMWAGLLYHHEDLERDELAKMMTGEDVINAENQGAMFSALKDFFPAISKGAEDAESPPEKKGRAKSGHGKKSSKT